MKKIRLPGVGPFQLFVAIMLAGVLVVTLLYRFAERETLSSPGSRPPAPYTGAATDAQKLYIAARSATSELLFKVTFAAFGALIAFQLSDARRGRVSERGVFAAAGLLITSLYAAFLFHVGVSHCMEASLDAIFGPTLSIPILCQFWFLFAAVVIIAAAVFRGVHPAAAGMAIIVLLAAQGADAGTTSPQCVRQWADSRSVKLSAAATNDAVALLNRMAVQESLKVPKADRCAFTTTMLDAVRYTAINDGRPATGTEGGAALAEILRAARIEAESPNLSRGELARILSSIAAIWHDPAGILDIDAGKTLFVIVTDRGPRSQGLQWPCYTRCVMRLPPGHYGVRAADGTRVVFDSEVDVADQGRVPIDAGARP